MLRMWSMEDRSRRVGIKASGTYRLDEEGRTVSWRGRGRDELDRALRGRAARAEERAYLPVVAGRALLSAHQGQFGCCQSPAWTPPSACRLQRRTRVSVGSLQQALPPSTSAPSLYQLASMLVGSARQLQLFDQLCVFIPARLLR